MEEDATGDENEPSLFALSVTAAVLFTGAAYVTATLAYTLVGTGVPVSPLLLIVPLIPIYMAVMHVDLGLPEGSRQKNRLLFAACFGPVIAAVLMAVTAPLPVLVDTVPRGGAFGLALTFCIVVGVLLLTRAQWVNRNRP